MPGQGHTPGPWHVGAVYGAPSVFTLADGLLTREVARCGMGHDDDPHAESNAQLISAAPELLSWLTKAAQLAEQQQAGGPDVPMASAWGWLAEQAQGAIAKAEGR